MWLKKFGLALIKGLQIVQGVAPYAAPIVAQINPQAGATVGAVVQQLNAIAAVVMQAEVFGAANNLTGAQKLAGASKLVEQIILSSDMLAKHKIQDEAKFRKGVDGVTSGIADILSSLEDKVETDSKT